MTSLQSQYLLYPLLACNTARTHHQPKIVTSGYFTRETGSWQQEKQHQMSQISDGYRHRQSEAVSVKTATHQPYALTLAQYWDVGIDLQGSMVQQSKGLGSNKKLETSLVQRWIQIDAADKRWLYMCLQTTEWEVRKELRPWGRQFRRMKRDDMGCNILRPKNSTGAHLPATLPPVHREMKLWHHTCCPQWTSVETFFSTTTLGRTQLVILLTF